MPFHSHNVPGSACPRHVLNEPITPALPNAHVVLDVEAKFDERLPLFFARLTPPLVCVRE